jgi:hypothetical protein
MVIEEGEEAAGFRGIHRRQALDVTAGREIGALVRGGWRGMRWQESGHANCVSLDRVLSLL